MWVWSKSRVWGNPGKVIVPQIGDYESRDHRYAPKFKLAILSQRPLNVQSTSCMRRELLLDFFEVLYIFGTGILLPRRRSDWSYWMGVPNISAKGLSLYWKRYPINTLVRCIFQAAWSRLWNLGRHIRTLGLNVSKPSHAPLRLLQLLPYLLQLLTEGLPTFLLKILSATREDLQNEPGPFLQ